MAGRHRSRNGIPKPTCLLCTTIPAAGWTYCPHHHEQETQRLAATWERELDRHQKTVEVQLPQLGKPLSQLTRVEQAALGRLIAWEHHDMVTPAPLSLGVATNRSNA